MADHELLAEHISKSFGGLSVLQNVSLNVRGGEILGLIGPNGAGKTTLFNIIAGAISPSEGRVTLDGTDVTSMKPSARCRLGIARTFQIPQPFLDLSVLDNIKVAITFGGGNRAATDLTDAAFQYLERVDIARWAQAKAAVLPLGGRKRLELARALATQPRVLLLDEVMGGLSAEERDGVAHLVEGLRQEQMAIIFVEHVMQAVMRLADRISVLHQGNFIASGAPADVVRDPAVTEAYFGGQLETS